MSAALEAAMGELGLVDPQRMPGPVSNTNFNNTNFDVE
jgi:hypothetical protein